MARAAWVIIFALCTGVGAVFPLLADELARRTRQFVVETFPEAPFSVRVVTDLAPHELLGAEVIRLVPIESGVAPEDPELDSLFTELHSEFPSASLFMSSNGAIVVVTESSVVVVDAVNRARSIFSGVDTHHERLSLGESAAIVASIDNDSRTISFHRTSFASAPLASSTVLVMICVRSETGGTPAADVVVVPGIDIEESYDSPGASASPAPSQTVNDECSGAASVPSALLLLTGTGAVLPDTDVSAPGAPPASPLEPVDTSASTSSATFSSSSSSASSETSEASSSSEPPSGTSSSAPPQPLPPPSPPTVPAGDPPDPVPTRSTTRTYESCEDPQLEAHLRRVVAGTSEADSLVLENRAQLHHECLPNENDRITCAFKFSRPDREGLFSVLAGLDGQLRQVGEELDNVNAACRVRRGNLDRELYELVTSVPPDTLLSIAVLRDAPSEWGMRNGGPAPSAPLKDLEARLASFGLRATHAIPAIDAVVGSAPASTVLQLGFDVTRSWPDVRSIKLATSPLSAVFSASSGKLIGHHIGLGSQSGSIAGGVPIALLEPPAEMPPRPGARFRRPNTDMNSPYISCVESLGEFSGATFETRRTTLTASVICGDGDPMLRGIAPGARLWIGGGVSTVRQYFDALFAKFKFGAVIMNHGYQEVVRHHPGEGCSLTELSMGSYLFDLLSGYDMLSIAHAGRIRNTDDKSLAVCNPAAGFNVLAVGGHLDEHQMDRRTRRPESLFGDRTLKPEIVGPDFVATTDLSPGTSANLGGSSTAVTTGVAAVVKEILQQTGSSSSPWLVKAILMASAVQRVKGVPQLGRDGLPRRTGERDWELVVTQEGQPASRAAVRHVTQIAGLGGLRADTAFALARGNAGIRKEYKIENCVIQYPEREDRRLSLVQGQRVRAVIAWDFNPFDKDYPRHPVDIDLQIIDPSGKPIASSVTWDNTVEAVEFEAPQAGFYTVSLPIHGQCRAGNVGPTRVALALFTGDFRALATVGERKEPTFIRSSGDPIGIPRWSGDGEVEETFCLMSQKDGAPIAGQSLEISLYPKRGRKRLWKGDFGKKRTNEFGCFGVDISPELMRHKGKRDLRLRVSFGGNARYTASSETWKISRKPLRYHLSIESAGNVAATVRPGATWNLRVVLKEFPRLPAAFPPPRGAQVPFRKVLNRTVDVEVYGPLPPVPINVGPEGASPAPPLLVQRTLRHARKTGEYSFSFDAGQGAASGDRYQVFVIFRGDGTFAPRYETWQVAVQ